MVSVNLEKVMDIRFTHKKKIVAPIYVKKYKEIYIKMFIKLIGLSSGKIFMLFRNIK